MKSELSVVVIRILIRIFCGRVTVLVIQAHEQISRGVRLTIIDGWPRMTRFASERGNGAFRESNWRTSCRFDSLFLGRKEPLVAIA